MDKLKELRDKLKNHIPLCIAAIVILLIISVCLGFYINHRYIQKELALAAQAQVVEDYDSALLHIDNVLRKDLDNQEALTLKRELSAQKTKKDTADKINSAKRYKDEGNYIEAYSLITDALRAEPDNAEAINLKNELLPLYQEQEKRNEEERAKRQAEQEAKEAAEKAEQDAIAESLKAEKEKDIKALIDTYVFDGELAVKILKRYKGYDSSLSDSYIYAYSQRSNDARGSYYNVAYTWSKDSKLWSAYKVYEDGTVEDILGTPDDISDYTAATNAESVRKDAAVNKQTNNDTPTQSQNSAPQQPATTQASSYVPQESEEDIIDTYTINGITVDCVSEIGAFGSRLACVVTNNRSDTVTAQIHFKFYDMDGYQLDTYTMTISNLGSLSKARENIPSLYIPSRAEFFEVYDIEIY